MATASVKAFWQRVSRIGAAGLPLEEERKVRALNQFALIAAASVGTYGAVLLTDLSELWVGALANFTAVAIHLTVLWHTHARRYALALAQFLLLCNVQLAFVSWWAGPTVGFHFYFFAFATVPFLVVPRRLWVLYPFAIVSTVLFVYFAFFMDAADAQVSILPFVATAFRLVTVVATCATLALIAFLFDDDAIEAEEQLEVQHARSEELLLNILPRSISDRLKDGEKSIADGFAEVTVVFADLVGFTELSSKLPPDELVHALNQVFSRFDDLALEHGLEKIKTIGDAYMAASGLPEPRKDHAVAAVRMALGMKRELDLVNEKADLSLQIRIGLHSGPVVAGVIGKKKFIYDLWGDTVNIASRMESHGVKGSVHLSETTAKLVEAEFELEARDPIQVKGKGEMRTFLVIRERSA